MAKVEILWLVRSHLEGNVVILLDYCTLLEATCVIGLAKIRLTTWCKIRVVSTHSILLLDHALLRMECIWDWVTGTGLETALIQIGPILPRLRALVHISDILSLICVWCSL